MTDNEKIFDSLNRLRSYIESEGFMGYDPYDALNSTLPLNALGRTATAIAVQIQKRNPINLRPMLGIKKGYNPKAMGILLKAYCILYGMKPDDKTKKTIEFLYNWLMDNFTRGYSGMCWGYNFDWSSPKHYLKAYTPTIVATSFIAKGLFEYYNLFKKEEVIETLKGICRFILNDLKITKTDDGICLSYTPFEPDCCYNASMLGAEVLAGVYKITKGKRLLEYSKEAVDFVVKRQRPDGRWNYSLDIKRGTEREQIDFHQGYVIESMDSFIKYTDIKDNIYMDSIKKGLVFYKKMQFFQNGRSLWRLPKRWPVDIHNQSQGIITFSRVSGHGPDYTDFAKTIALWTIENMQDKKGFFYYRKGRFFDNKTAYMRWAEAWMFLALAELVKMIGK